MPSGIAESGKIITVGGSPLDNLVAQPAGCCNSTCGCLAIFPSGAPSQWIIHGSDGLHTCTCPNSGENYNLWVAGASGKDYLFVTSATEIHDITGGCDSTDDPCPYVYLQVNFNPTSRAITAITVVANGIKPVAAPTPISVQWSASAGQLAQLSCGSSLAIGNLINGCPTDCANLPSTVTLTPVSNGNPGAPDIGINCDFRVTIAGVTGNLSVCSCRGKSGTDYDCSIINGTWNLRRLQSLNYCRWDAGDGSFVTFETFYKGSQFGRNLTLTGCGFPTVPDCWTEQPAQNFVTTPLPDCAAIGLFINISTPAGGGGYVIVDKPYAEARQYPGTASGGDISGTSAIITYLC